jgi:hypothetical protein
MKHTTFSRWLLMITVTHLSLGLVIFWPMLQDMVMLGWVNSAGRNNLGNSTAFWFLMFSTPMFLLVISGWSRTDTVNKPLAIASIFFSVIGGATLPVSGFWTLTLLGIFALIMNLRSKQISQSDI